jgi:hypothetical protein
MYLPNIKVFSFASASAIRVWGIPLAYVAPKVRSRIVELPQKEQELILKNIEKQLGKYTK